MSDTMSGPWEIPYTAGGYAPNYSYPYPYSYPYDHYTSPSSGYGYHYEHNAAPDFRCGRCIHYGGGCKCNQNIFIFATGVDMSCCWGFEEGTKCRHCGGIT